MVYYDAGPGDHQHKMAAKVMEVDEINGRENGVR